MLVKVPQAIAGCSAMLLLGAGLSFSAPATGGGTSTATATSAGGGCGRMRERREAGQRHWLRLIVSCKANSLS
jgi:hypothetical protein